MHTGRRGGEKEMGVKNKDMKREKECAGRWKEDRMSVTSTDSTCPAACLIAYLNVEFHSLLMLMTYRQPMNFHLQPMQLVSTLSCLFKQFYHIGRYKLQTHVCTYTHTHTHTHLHPHTV